MSLTVLPLRFARKRNCFISVPRHLIQQNEEGIPIFTLTSALRGNVLATLSWHGDFSGTQHGAPIEICSQLGECLGFRDNEQVLVTRRRLATPPCRHVTLKPVSADDWQILSLNATRVEECLMDQIRVVEKSFSFPIWIETNLCVIVRVASIQPSDGPSLLTQDTQVVVVPELDISQLSVLSADLPDEVAHSGGGDSATSSSSVFSALRSLVASVTSRSSEGQVTSQDLLESDASFLPDEISPKKIVLDGRIMRIKTDSSYNSTRVFVRVPPSTNVAKTSFIATLRMLQSPLEHLAKQAKSKHSSSAEQSVSVLPKIANDLLLDDVIIVRVVVVRSVENILEGFVPDDDSYRYNINDTLVFVDDVVRRRLALPQSCRVRLESVNYAAVASADQMILRSLSKRKITADNLRSWMHNSKISASNPAVFATGTFLQLAPDLSAIVELLVSSSAADVRNFVYVWNSQQDRLPVVVSGDIILPVVSKLASVMVPVSNVDKLCKTCVLQNNLVIGGVSTEMDALCSQIELELGIRSLACSLLTDNCNYLRFGAILVAGAKGTGKSALVREIGAKFEREMSLQCYVHVIECQMLRGKRGETLQKDWERAIEECVYRRPAILIFDDLDTICGTVVTQEQENSPDALYYAKISQVFLSCLASIRDSTLGGVAVVATANSWSSLNPALTLTQGLHCFPFVVDLVPPDTKQRVEILAAILASNQLAVGDECVLGVVATRTEGAVPLDLRSLCIRAAHTRIMRGDDMDEQMSVLSMDDFESALSNFVPSSHTALGINSSEKQLDVRFEDIGGLNKVKSILQETFLWPVKYPELFANCPIRPLSGILLYGAPGTGKTLLASAVASQCKLNFINIKGPELLSKYIGASEMAVRQVFQRAQNAKPCVIFFDEFDSMAPRRGHDNTGVTDRIVNQLLTLLDGVETKSGVYILAATSRPDLIDPALLRPGRLDKSLECTLPDQNERREILECLSRRLSLDDDVDFNWIAENTNHFSGADLQALLYTAQLAAIHDSAKHTRDVTSPFTEGSNTQYTIIPSLSSTSKELDPTVEVAIRHRIEALTSRGQSGHRRLRRQSTLLLTVRRHHLEEALQSSRASLTPQERMKFNAIYEAFRSGGSTSIQAILKQQRVTLA